MALVLAENEGRVESLVPIRMARMSSSAFAFYRGAAGLMASDLLATPQIGADIQICGDAHLANFGVFASPERALVFDLNDFDETDLGPWEWDVKRLVTSAVIAGRDRGFTDAQCRRAALAGAQSYRQWTHGFARQPTLDVWYDRVDAKAAVAMLRSLDAKTLHRGVRRTRSRTSDLMLHKLTDTDGPTPRIVDQPPLIEHVDIDLTELSGLYDGYRASLPEDRRALLDQFRVVDFARKVVGVGSVGTRCFIALLLDDSGAPLFLQIKEASPSVVAGLGRGRPTDHDGRRVVSGQRHMQAVSDVFLGWTASNERHGYVRQLADMKGGVDLETVTPKVLEEYLGACGWALARAHARSGQASVVSGYLGGGDVFDCAVVDFACAYADQNAADHARFREAVAAR